MNVHGWHLIRGGVAVWARVHEAFVSKPFLWGTPAWGVGRASASGR